MPYDGSGNFGLNAGYRATTGQTILASQHNPPLEDIASGLSQVLLRSGVAPMMGNLNMNGFRIAGLPEAAGDSDPVLYSQFQALQTAIDAIWPVGTVLGFEWKTAPPGWVKRNNGSIGSATSGATTRANEDTRRLFTHYWTTFSNTEKPIQNPDGTAGTRGASADADFDANKRMPLWDSRSRFHRGADDGLGFDTSLTVGSSQADAIKNHTHPVPANSINIQTSRNATSSTDNFFKGGAIDNTMQFPITASVTGNNSDGIALETRPRSSTLLFCIKL